jgi:hypothetical protein
MVGLQLWKIPPDSFPALLFGLLVVAGLCVVALFASGALLSIGKTDYAVTRAGHRIALAVLAAALTVAAFWLAKV